MALKTDKYFLGNWQEFRDNVKKATPIDINETAAEKISRISKLEKDFEKWAKYYFPNYYSSEPAPFHVKASKRILANPEWYEVRSWSRELAKTSRTMMEVLFLTLTGKKRNVLLVSATEDDAIRILERYRLILEFNNRIIADYGVQKTHGKWKEGDFKTRKGVAFLAIGAGQSPRGTSNEEIRPDVILIDDIDTDIDCRNPETIKSKFGWIEQALIPTRSISVALLIIACGNIIAEYCCITEMAKKADIHEIINIRDKNGKSTWPNKNKEEMIDRVLGSITTSSAEKEYFNNPVTVGDIFEHVPWGKCPPLQSCEVVLTYSDPATSNKDKKDNSKGSTKGTGVIGYKDGKYYLFKIWLDVMGQRDFVKTVYSARDYTRAKGIDTFRQWIENNSLQDPFWEQVLKPLVLKVGKELKKPTLAMSLDKRKKGEKFDRIEATLEPLFKDGDLIFNEDEKDNPAMKRMGEQFVGVGPKSKFMDGPDLLEGGVWKIQNRVASGETSHATGARQSFKY